MPFPITSQQAKEILDKLAALEARVAAIEKAVTPPKSEPKAGEGAPKSKSPKGWF